MLALDDKAGWAFNLAYEAEMPCDILLYQRELASAVGLGAMHHDYESLQ